MELRDIINWIVDHSDDEDAMNKVAMTAYPYSRKFKERHPSTFVRRTDEENGDDISVGVHI